MVFAECPGTLSAGVLADVRRNCHPVCVRQSLRVQVEMQSQLSAAPAQDHVEVCVTPRSSWTRVFRAEWLIFLLFVGPNLLLFAIFTYYPMIRAFYLSAFRWDMI